METINNIASSASKAIWGDSTDNTTATETQKPVTDSTTTTSDTANMSTTNETQGQEPVSGKLGDTSKGEPFDAGNIEPSTTTQTKDETAGDVAVSKGPTTEHPSTTGDTGFKAAQADIRDPETSATTDPKKEEERKNVDDTGALDDSANPGKVDGPGPRPIDEVARERGGDAGRNPDGSGAGVDAADSKDGAVEGESNETKGSGEEYVKSSGLQADGGDFDATKPGAGREADRLLEEKGIDNPAAAAAAHKPTEDKATGAESPDAKEKKSLKDKIKAKLHKN